MQWGQLLVLSAVHGIVDACPGVLAPLLPKLRVDMALTMKESLYLLSVLNLVCNGVQLVTGHLRPYKQRCLLIPIGTLLASAIFLMGILPSGTVVGKALLFAIVAISAIGVAIMHPEVLRAVHALDRIPPSISSAVFLNGGVIGFGGGAWLGTAIVERWGLEGLLVLVPGSIAVVVLVLIMKIRLAVEQDAVEVANSNQKDAAAPDSDNLAQQELGELQPPRQPVMSFWAVLTMTIPSAIATVLLVGLVPTRLAEVGLPLEFGGRSSMLFMTGTLLGTLVWGTVATRRDTVRCCVVASLLGVPFVWIYLSLLENSYAVWALAAVGFTSNGVFALMVVMARQSVGPRLGVRMALIVGGSWGAGSIVLMAMGPVAQRWGTDPILKAAAIGYIIAGAVGIWQLLRRRGLRAQPS